MRIRNLRVPVIANAIGVSKGYLFELTYLQRSRKKTMKKVLKHVSYIP